MTRLLASALLAATAIAGAAAAPAAAQTGLPFAIVIGPDGITLAPTETAAPPPAPVTNPDPAHSGPVYADPAMPFQSGSYVGRWNDGRMLYDSIVFINDGLITMQRQDGFSQPVPFYRVSGNVFRNANGSTLTIHPGNTMVWANADGQNAVVYARM